MSFPHQRGFTIADSLVALAIVTFSAVTLVGVVPYAFGQTQHDAIVTQANAAGQQFLDGIRYDILNGMAVPTSATAPIDFGESFIDSGADAVTGNFALTSSCTAQNSGLMEDCTVTVQWTENHATRQVVLETYITELI